MNHASASADVASPRVVYVDANDHSFAVMQRTGLLQRLESISDLTVHMNTPVSCTDFLTTVGDAEVAIVGGSLPDIVLEQARQLKLVAYIGLGATNFINHSLAAAKEIAIAVTPDYGREAVSEHTIALLFAVARRIAEGDRHVREHKWRPFSSGTQLAGKTVGVLGYGGIGAHTASLLSALGMNVLAWTRSPPADRAPGIQFIDLDDLLDRADVLTLHLALSENTHGFLTGPMLDRLRTGAIVINTARAELIEPGALESRLRSGQLSAGLDVYTTEPPMADNPLLRLDNVVLSPHQGYNTPEAFTAMLEMVVDNIDNYSRSLPFHQPQGRARHARS